MNDKNKIKYQEWCIAHNKTPKTRRDFLGMGMLGGAGFVMAPSLVSLLYSGQAYGLNCSSAGVDGMAGMMCFDLAGGAALAGATAMVGKRGGQMDALASY